MLVDLLANALVSVKNASARKLSSTKVRSTKFVDSVLKRLEQEGYVGKVQTQQPKENGFGHETHVELIYNKNGVGIIKDYKKVSKSSLRIYMNVDQLFKLHRNRPQYLYVISTNVGILSIHEAVERKIGGEVLFYMSRHNK